MKLLATWSIFFLNIIYLNAQVGIGTTNPQAQLDILSSNSGILIPRIALASVNDNTSVTNPDGGSLVDGTMVWNTGTLGLPQVGYYYWQNGRWNIILSDNYKYIHFGKLTLSTTGTVSVTGVGFTPRSVEFIAINRVQGYNNGAYRGDTNNSNDIRIAGGMTTGYAQNNGGTIDQQAITNAFSGSSINNIGTYSSNAHCFAALFVTNNADPISDVGTNSGASTQDGLVRAEMVSFDIDGFTINVDRFLGPTTTSPDRTNTLVVLYKAYR